MANEIVDNYTVYSFKHTCPAPSGIYVIDGQSKDDNTIMWKGNLMLYCMYCGDALPQKRDELLGIGNLIGKVDERARENSKSITSTTRTMATSTRHEIRSTNASNRGRKFW